MIRLQKEDSELVVRIDLDTAPSPVEKLWAAYQMTLRRAERNRAPEVLELVRIAHSMVVHVVAQLLADACTEAAAERAYRADDPDAETKGVVH